VAVASVSAASVVRDIAANTWGFGWPIDGMGVGRGLLLLAGPQTGTATLSRVLNFGTPTPAAIIDKVLPLDVAFDPKTNTVGLLRDSDDDEVPELWTVPLGGSAATQLAEAPELGTASRGGFSPAGDRLVWGVDKAANGLLGQLLIAPAGGTAPVLAVGREVAMVRFADQGTVVFSGQVGGADQGAQGVLRAFDGVSPARVVQPGVRDFDAFGRYVMFAVSGQGTSDGLYRLSLDAPAAAPASCDPLARTGCQSGQACYLRGPGDVTLCDAVGAGAPGDPCKANDACGPGLQCAGGVCRHICDVAGTSCPQDLPTCVAAPGNARLGVCAQPGAAPSGCDPVLQTGCQDALEACYATDDTGALACLGRGTTGDGSPCQQHSDCVPGTGCFEAFDGSRCRRYCDPLAQPQTCAADLGCVQLGGSPWGVCKP
jgi:hypothetical protein